MKFFRIGILFGAIVALDRLTKISMVRGFDWNFSILHLGLFPNHGLIFSIPAPMWVSVGVMFIAIAIVGIMLIRAMKKNQTIVALAMSFIIIGALSNLVDRLWYGYVIDFISFGRWFTIFNLADVTIAVGLVFWLRDLTKRKNIA